MNRGRRIGVWLLWTGVGLSSLSLVTCFGVVPRMKGDTGLGWAIYLAIATIVGFVLLLAGGIVVLVTRGRD